jgi:hypothetical protein
VSTTIPPGPGVGQHPAAWLKDPTGRHEYRYWEGTRWTDDVSDAGRPSKESVPEHLDPPLVHNDADAAPAGVLG